MGSTVTRNGEPSLARCGPVTSSRWRGGEREDAPATQPDRRLPTLSDCATRSTGYYSGR